MKQSVAIIGSGISGLTAAYLLRDTFEVTLFEADQRLGGHSHTHTVNDASGPLRVDSGFIVHNDRTYPHLRRLFRELGIATQPTEMSMSIACAGCGLQFAGGRGVRGIFAQRRRLFDPRFIKLLLDVKRFQKRALALLDTEESEDEPQTYGDFLTANGFSQYFVGHYAVPVVSCVWSSGHADALQYPARYLFEFLRHHGFLSISGSPQWFTVTGGSATYVEAVAAAIGDVRTDAAITSVSRTASGIELRDHTGTVHSADRVVIATHADEALGLLTDPTPAETKTLGAFGYSVSDTVLHRDASVLPSTPGARAAWNYYKAECDASEDSVQVSYWMNRLQGLKSVSDFIVTLNQPHAAADEAIEATMRYTHPIYTPDALAAQRQLDQLADDRVVFAGAYHGWGFHEDGCRSGVEAVRHWGVTW